MAAGEFSVFQYFPDGAYEEVATAIDAETAMRITVGLTRSVGGQLGTTARVIITDCQDPDFNDAQSSRVGNTTPSACFHSKQIKSSRMPGYWMHETSGVLRPAVETYLNRHAMTGEQIAVMRAYLRQWINGDFRGPEIALLRNTVHGLDSREKLRHWLDRAFDAGIDPL